MCKEKEEGKMSVAASGIKSKLEELAKRAEKRKSQNLRRELTPKQKEIYRQNCEDLEAETFYNITRR